MSTERLCKNCEWWDWFGYAVIGKDPRQCRRCSFWPRPFWADDGHRSNFTYENQGADCHCFKPRIQGGEDDKG